MDINTEWFGAIAGGLTTASFLPQVYKTWKTKSVDSLSMPMLLMMTVGIFVWGVYGVVLESVSMMVSNAITFISSSLLVYFKLKYK